MLPIADRNESQLFAVDGDVAMEMRPCERTTRFHPMRGLNCAVVTISNAACPRALREAARKSANTRDTNYLRTKLGYRVTGQTIKSYYILGSRTKLASCIAPGVTFLEAR